MSRMSGLRRIFRMPATERTVTAEVDEEIAFHLEERRAELVAKGMAPAEAHAAALREFGDVSGARSELVAIGRRRVRRSRRTLWWSDLGQDVRYGVRASLRAPLFSLLAITTLALGIGANAAVFGVLKSVLLDALPYADAERLVRVYGRMLDGTVERGAMSAGTVTDVRERQQSFERLSAFLSHTVEAVYGGDDGPRVTQVARVEPDLFQTLGVTPVAGRSLLPEDAGDTARVTLIAHAAWQRLFGGDPDVLGRDVLIDGLPRTVVGVLPRGFVGPMGDADFYLPLDLRGVLSSPVSARRSHFLGAIGRLRPGVPAEAARQEVTAIGAALALEHPEASGSMGVTSMPLRQALAGETRTPLLVLMASAALVLLIACANLAGALLSRAIGRRQEFAVRVALGAGRGRLVRQLLTESVLLAVVGGTAGLALAIGGLAALRRLALPALPDHANLSLDPSAVAVTALLAVLTGLAFGAAPALSVVRADPQGTLREGSREAGESRRSRALRGALVAGQIALCLSLLAGAGLLARSLWAMTSRPLGFVPEGVLTLSVQLPGTRYGDAESITRFQHEYLDRLRGLPGVTDVASVTMPPTAVMSSMGFTIVDAPPPPSDAQPFVLFAVASDDYFRALRIPLRSGRVFDARDHVDAPPAVIISESMARRFWPAGDALGARIRLGPDPNSTPLEVVGVVGDVRNDLSSTEPEPIAYRSIRQAPWPLASFLVRASGDPSALVRAAERELMAIDLGLPLHRATPLQALIGEALSARRLPAFLMSAFAVLALLLASVGVYAMFASMAAAREREFGVRMALGSSRARIASLVLRQGAIWMTAGLAAGALGVFLVVRLLRELLFGVAPFDPVSLGLAVLSLAGCATLALLAPVRRATRVDPAITLRAQ